VLLLFSAVLLAFLIAVSGDPFFWDAVQLGSKHAHFFYDNNLSWGLLPAHIDSGHLPAWGYYLAVVWAAFGKSLLVSHLAVWPFAFGILYVSAALGHAAGGPTLGYWLIPLVLLDPVAAGQLAGMGPDVALLFFFLLGVWSVLRGHPVLTALAVLGLCAISMRGMVASAALGTWQLVYLRERCRPLHILAYIPGILLAAGFLMWHYREAGWIGHHPGSPWQPAFERVDMVGAARNALILGWRWADLGRWAEWVVLVAFGWTYRKHYARSTQPWLMLLLLTALLLAPSALLYANLGAHRYFLPVFMALHLAVLWAIAHAPRTHAQNIRLMTLLVVSLGFGNLWVYPHGVAMTWDSTLVHRSYHGLRADVVRYMDQNGIPFDQTGSAFPNLNTGAHLLLNGDQRCFSPFDPEKQSYILASNVFNDIDKRDLEALGASWVRIRHREQGGIWMSLYARKAP
jgi:hypothetical protein